jgi:LCP family protein required for cell wall assembly
MSKKSEFLKNTAILAFGKLSVQLVALILLPIYTTFLSPSEFGLYDLIFTYVVLLAPAVTIQLEMSVFRHLIDVRKSKAGKVKIISSTLELLGGALGLIAVAALLLSQFVTIPYFWLVIVLLGTFATSGVLMQIARGLGAVTSYAIASGVAAIVTLLAGLLFVVVAKLGVSGVLLSVIAANLAAIIYLSIANKLWQLVRRGASDRATKKSLLAYSLPLVPNNAALWIMNSADRTIIALFLDVAANGIYAVAARFPFALMGLFSVYNMSWTEAVSTHINSKDKDRDAFLSDAFNTGMKLVASVGLVMIALMHFVFPVLINSDFNEAYLYIPILTTGVVASAAMSMFGAVYIAKKMTKKVALTSIYAAVLNVVLALVLVPLLGLYGAAIASALSFGAIAIIRHFDLRKHINLTYDVRNYAVLAVGYVAVCALYYATNFLYDLLAVALAAVIIYAVNKSEIMSVISKLSAKTIFMMRVAVTILWMLVIFYLSSEGKDVSSDRSGAVVEAVRTIVLGIPTDVLTFLTRKAAHIAAYFILGILILSVIRTKVAAVLRAALISIAAVALYAISDEIHQLFVPGRSGEVRDVLIDTIAGALGIGLVYAVLKIRKRQRSSEPKIRKLSKVVAGVLAVSFLFMAYALFMTQVLPGKYLGPFFLTATIVTALAVYLQFFRTLSVKKTVAIMLISVVMILSNAAIFAVGISATSFLNSVQSGASVQEYSIVAIKGRQISLDTPNQTAAFLATDSQEVRKGAAGKTDATAQNFSDPTAMTVGLQDNTVQLAIFSSSYLQLLKETNNNEAYRQLEVLATFTVSVASTPPANIDVTKPFILYISGIDTYGEISEISRSDVNIMVVVNPRTHKILLVNTPRDYYVQLHGTTGRKDKLTHAGIYGVETSASTLEDLYSVPIDYMMRINFSSLVKVVDSIGGVDVYSEYDFTADGTHFTVGTNRLSGQQALAFSRERHSFEGGDRTRGENQLKVIRAIIAKLSTPAAAVRYQQVLASLQGAFQTNMSTEAITSLARTQLDSMAKWETSSVSVDGTGSSDFTYSTGNARLYVMVPDQATVDAAKQKIRQYLAP